MPKPNAKTIKTEKTMIIKDFSPHGKLDISSLAGMIFAQGDVYVDPKRKLVINWGVYIVHSSRIHVTHASFQFLAMTVFFSLCDPKLNYKSLRTVFYTMLRIGNHRYRRDIHFDYSRSPAYTRSYTNVGPYLFVILILTGSCAMTETQRASTVARGEALMRAEGWGANYITTFINAQPQNRYRSRHCNLCILRL